MLGDLLLAGTAGTLRDIVAVTLIMVMLMGAATLYFVWK